MTIYIAIAVNCDISVIYDFNSDDGAVLMFKTVKVTRPPVEKGWSQFNKYV
jgi:hypothetical protein